MARVVDPRHPLYGLTMPVLRMGQAPGEGPSYVVLFRGKIERKVPVTMTDRSPEPIMIPTLSLDLGSVRQLLTTYQHIRIQLAEDTDHGTNKGTNNNLSAVVPVARVVSQREGTGSTDATQASMDVVESGPTAASDPHAGDDLLPSGQGKEPAEPGGGGA